MKIQHSRIVDFVIIQTNVHGLKHLPTNYPNLQTPWYSVKQTGSPATTVATWTIQNSLDNVNTNVQFHKVVCYDHWIQKLSILLAQSLIVLAFLTIGRDLVMQPHQVEES